MKKNKKTTSPLSPADLPELVLTLARCELRDAADALVCARARCKTASSAMRDRPGADWRLLSSFAEHAEDRVTYAEWGIRNVLLMLWGIAVDYEDARNGPDPHTKTWTPVGALVEGRWFCWIEPGDNYDGQPSNSFEDVRVRVIDGEDLADDNMDDDDWDRLLEHPPCRYVVLGHVKPPVVVEAAVTSTA